MRFTTVYFAIVLGAVSSFPQNSKTLHSGLMTRHNVAKENNVGIFKGNSTTMNTHRYLVSLLKDGTFQCAGIIVSVNWILTLADCTSGVEADLLTVVDGSADGVTGGLSHTVEQIVQHPDYGNTKLDYDFSCVQISDNFYYGKKRAHKLPSEQLADYSTMNVAGYGCTTSGCGSRELLTATMVWLPKENCTKTYSSHSLNWERLGCAYSPEGATLCKGDFGDAFVNGQVFYGLFASVSSTGFCSTKARPVILTDVFAVADWVRNVTGAV